MAHACYPKNPGGTSACQSFCMFGYIDTVSGQWCFGERLYSWS